MRPFGQPKPPEKEFVTTGGVKVVVTPRSTRPPPPPSPPPPPPAPVYAEAIVIPPMPQEELDGWISDLCQQHMAVVLRMLRSRGDVQEASAEDMAQNIVLALWQYVRATGQMPHSVRGFLTDLVYKELANRGRVRQRKGTVGREPDMEDALVDEGPWPEEALDERERTERVKHCIANLPHHQAEAIRYVDLLEKTLEVAALALGRSLPTLARHRAQGIAKLRELANDEEEPPPPGVGLRRRY